MIRTSHPLWRVGLLAMGLAACRPPATSGPPQVRLSVTPAAPSFAQGDPVVLNLDFENTGTAPTEFSAMTDGNVRIVTLLRDGAAVIPRETTIRIRPSLAGLLSQNMTRLAAGAHATVRWESRTDPPQNAQALKVVRYDPEGAHTASLAAVGRPGTYEMTIVYRFGDPWGRPADVFAGETNFATVSFVVAP